jgi:hypothetical protein
MSPLSAMQGVSTLQALISGGNSRSITKDNLVFPSLLGLFPACLSMRDVVGVFLPNSIDIYI